MNLTTMLQAALLGFVEGLTEFLPVSSTGHLLLIGHFLGFDSPNKTFEVLVQLGAILAILSLYFHKLIDLARGVFTDPAKRRFVLAVIIAFLPAMIIGGLFSKAIKATLFNPFLVCCTLIAGGLILLVVDETKFEEKYHDMSEFPLMTALKIGAFQCIAMVPGVSRSGATIVGAMLMGSSKRAAAEFSFFLAMPTMAGAFAKDLLDNYKNLAAKDFGLIAIGFVMAFVSGLIVVRTFLDFVSKRGFKPFAYWRIAVGSLGLIGLAVFG
jgi:undecaprenyl-diphosphatase